MIRFFVSGYNKSGTTYLQMLLDGHPAIHCPSEQYFNLILHVSEQLSTEYEKQIAKFDKNTANQGVQFDKNRFFTSIVRNAVLAQMDTGIVKGTTHTGLNDNSIIDRGPFWAQIFPDAHFLFIVRDPRALAVSIWHHRTRTEPEFAKSGATVDAVAGALARSWPKHVDRLMEFKRDHADRVMIVRYEDLIGESKVDFLVQILGQLGISTDRDTLESMFQRVDFEKLKEKEGQSLNGKPGFFRQGSSRGWETALAKSAVEAFVNEGSSQLETFGYLC